MNEYHKSNGTSSGGSVYQTIAEVAEAQGIGPPHYVLHNPEKSSISKGWQATPANADAATQHRGLVGVIPSSLGMVVIDLDHGGSGGVVSVQALLGPPLKVIPTAKEGHFHLYYREPATGCPMYQWQYKGASGEVLSSTRSAIMHHPEHVLDALERRMEDTPANLAALPSMSSSDARSRRNNTLNAEMFSAARNSDKQAQVVAFAKAIMADLPAPEVWRTADSAITAAEAKNDDATARVRALLVRP